MSTYRLERLLSPRSVALVGGSPRPRSVGRAILANLNAAGFKGPIHLVNPRYDEIEGVRAVGSLADLASPPDVVVVAVPPGKVPSVVSQAAEVGAAAAIIITAGLGPGPELEACEAAAKAKGLRLVGPNCLGVAVPASGFNATFAATQAQPGELALVSQSGAVAAGTIEWAARRGVGCSAIVSIGNQLDVDFGDMLDYFALDGKTRAILLYIESVKDARKFMSAARAAARTKPVVVIKAGRHAQAARAAATHTGALAGSDSVYEAAFRRAGLLRVFDLGELFDAAETLGRVKGGQTGNRLAVLTNGGGAGVLAVDRLIDLGGVPAEISAATRARLDAVMPQTWSRSNPVDIVGDADQARYRAALEALVDDPANDAVLVMNVQTALASAADIARAVAEFSDTRRAKGRAAKLLFAVWLGEEASASDAFNRAGIPHFATETDAVRGFMHLVRHHEAIANLMATPPAISKDFTVDIDSARRIVRRAVAEGRSWLDIIETEELLRAYQIPTVPTVRAAGPAEAEAAATPFLTRGNAVAVKILSRDIVHKSDVGGVRLNVAGGAEVREAAAQVIAGARSKRPDASIEGVLIQPMVVRPYGRELIAGIADDPTFGPVIVFGQGGTAVEVINDQALALPPLDLNMARDLIARTRVSRILGAYRDVPAAKMSELALALVKLAQLAADLPEIIALDINPLLADDTGVVAVDARVAVAPLTSTPRPSGHPRFAVRPYPAEWERWLVSREGWRVFVRPVRPEDEDLFHEFFENLSEEDLRLRFFAAVKDFSHVFIARLTQLDYARAMAFVALDETTGKMLGAVRLHADANHENAEYAILLRSDLKGRGLGWKLMELIIEYARREGLKRIEGQVLPENSTMLRMCVELGFTIENDPRDSGIRLAVLRLA